VNSQVAKEKLRYQAKQKIALLNETEKAKLNSLIGFQLKNFLENSDVLVKSLGVYLPLKGEVELPDLGNNIELSIPMIQANSTMIFVRKSAEDILSKKLKYDFVDLNFEEVHPDALIVPGLLFDSSGSRLGRGKGYYDRYLQRFLGLKIGICYNIQKVEQVAVESHDIKLDYIITENEIIKCLKEGV
jgi:5-formyltetrahydrofolate cyclo-ligase